MSAPPAIVPRPTVAGLAPRQEPGAPRRRPKERVVLEGKMRFLADVAEGQNPLWCANTAEVAESSTWVACWKILNIFDIEFVLWRQAQEEFVRAETLHAKTLKLKRPRA